MSNITIYHNPACGTSRNTLEMIRNSGTEPTIIHYLELRQRAMNWSNSLPIWGFPYARCLRKNVETV